MLRKNLTIAYRNLLKNKTVSFINILGLSLGLASALIAVIFARHELTFENYHEKRDQIARIFLYGDFGQIKKLPTTYGPEGEAIKNIFPEVEKSSVSTNDNAIIKVGDFVFKEDHVTFVDSNYFSLFTFHFILGAPIKNNETVVLSKKTARRYFGDANPLGKKIQFIYLNQKTELTVTGVYEDLPSNTVIQTNIIVSLSFNERYRSNRYKEYNSTDYNSYLLLKPGTDIKALNNKIAANYKIPVKIENLKAVLLPFKELHFNGVFDNNRVKLIAFLIGGLFVLFTSCFNYINLTNILFASRSFENGIRVVNGGSRRNLFFLFITDSALSTFISYNIAFIILVSILPWFNSVMDTQIRIALNMGTIISIIGLFVFTIFFSGLYPALKFSGNKPVDLIKHGGVTINNRNWSRVVLTSFQFILAAIFIQVLLLMNRQTAHITNKDIIGYNPENVICLPGDQWGDLNKVRDELKKNPKIESVSWCSSIPSMGMNMSTDWINEGNKVMAMRIRYDYDFTDVYKIKMDKGRFFSRDYLSDAEKGIVINQKAADELKFKDPVGKEIWVDSKNYTIIGVISYYMATPPIFTTMPLLIRLKKNMGDYLVIRINSNDRQSTHQYITETLQKINPDYPINIRYHNEVIYDQREAKSFISAGYLMNLFFILTILMSIGGLFGLSVFIAQKYRKEVGIRKVCGATGFGLVIYLMKGVLTQGIMAVLIATPVSWMFAKAYLSMFPIHFEPGILFFVSGGAIALFILLTTVSWQTLRAASRNPVESLRYE